MSRRHHFAIGLGVLLAAACGLDVVVQPSDVVPGGGPNTSDGDGSAPVDAASTSSDAPPPPPPPPPPPSGAFAKWTARRLLAIDNSSFGALVGFPLLVELDATRIDFTKTKPQGEDLRFADAKGVELAYEIESIQNEHAIIWLNVPAIAAATTTYLWMYYGNAAAPPGATSTPLAVWDASYVGVWHLNDEKDATKRNTSTNNGAQVVDGRIGRGMRFDGTSLTGKSIDTGSSTQLDRWTVEAWFNAKNAPDQSGWYGPIMRDQNYGMGWDCNPTFWPRSAQSISVLIPGSADAGVCLQGWCTSVLANATGSDAMKVGTWYHGVATYDQQSLIAYTNGAQRDKQSVTGKPGAITSTAKIGANSSLSRFFIGTVDEVRISSVARSADWIGAEYKSMAGKYVTYGAETSN